MATLTVGPATRAIPLTLSESLGLRIARAIEDLIARRVAHRQAAAQALASSPYAETRSAQALRERAEAHYRGIPLG